MSVMTLETILAQTGMRMWYDSMIISIIVLNCFLNVRKCEICILILDKTVEKLFVNLQIQPLHSYINNSAPLPLIMTCTYISVSPPLKKKDCLIV